MLDDAAKPLARYRSAAIRRRILSFASASRRTPGRPSSRSFIPATLMNASCRAKRRHSVHMAKWNPSANRSRTVKDRSKRSEDSEDARSQLNIGVKPRLAVDYDPKSRRSVTRGAAGAALWPCSNTRPPRAVFFPSNRRAEEKQMNSISARNGLIAGFAATLVLSVMMILKSVMGLMPAVNAIRMLTQMGAAYFHTPAVPIVGWVAHFVIGTIAWGLVFAAAYRIWPGRSPAVKGIAFSVLAWLMMMIIVMPMAGAGLFGISLGMAAPVATLVLHVVFGAVLGVVYAKLQGTTEAEESGLGART